MLLSLLRSRNRCLERFLKVSQEYLSLSDDEKVLQIEALEAGRASALKAIMLFDSKIDLAISALTPEERTESLVENVRHLLREREVVFAHVQKCDSEINETIERLGRAIEREILSLKKSKEVIGKFKSGSSTPGGEFDGHV